MNIAHDFTKRLQDLLRREHVALTDFLLALAEFDERRLWVDLGYASLFDFLHRELRLSKSATFYRKTAVALVRKFPEVAEALREGKLCLMTVAEVARVLTPENRAEVLPRFFGLSKREAKELAAALLPCEAPPLRAVVTAIRAPSSAPGLALATSPAPAGEQAAAAPVLPVEPFALHQAATPPEQACPAVPPEAPAATVEPLTAELRRLHVTVTDRFLRKLDAVRAALSHSHPTASEEALLELGLDLLLERHEKRKGLVKKPLEVPRPSKNPDHVPAHVRRAVWERDGGRCQFPLASGGVCGSTWRVEIDHIHPRAAGGPSTIENCRMACGRHNDHAARQFFGDAWMDRFTRGMRAGTAGGHAERSRSPRGRGSSATGASVRAPP